MMSTDNPVAMLTKELTNLLSPKTVFVFDWDGTIFDSMQVKSDNFVKAFLWAISTISCSATEKNLEYHYRRLSGRPRKEIFYEILTILGMEPTSYLYDEFSRMFEKLNMTSLIHAPVFPDALVLMNELIQRNGKIYISSSVPPNELQEIVEAVLSISIRRRVSKVLGSKDGFSKGSEHIGFIRQDCNVTNHQIIVFGDDRADYELSADAGVDCILIDRSINGSQQAGPIIINSFSKIKDSLAI